MRYLKYFMLVSALLFVGCGSPTEPENDQELATAPTIDLSASMKLENSEEKKELSLAYGESVVLTWKTSENPETCQASGDWSGKKSCQNTDFSGRVDTTPGLDTGCYTFIITARNSAGSDADTVYVEVAEPSEKHALSDREDDIEGEQVHVMYVTTEDGQDRRLDLDGTIEEAMEAAQDWFRNESEGDEICFDTYEGRLDVTFVRIPKTSDEINLGGDINNGIRESRAELNHKKYIVVYDGEINSNDSGSAGPTYGRVYLTNIKDAPWWKIGVHEMFHTLGAVSENAPNHCDNGHVCDSKNDIMSTRLTESSKLDVGGDDYYNKKGLDKNVSNLHEKPHLSCG